MSKSKHCYNYSYAGLQSHNNKSFAFLQLVTNYISAAMV